MVFKGRIVFSLKIFIFWLFCAKFLNKKLKSRSSPHQFNLNANIFITMTMMKKCIHALQEFAFVARGYIIRSTWKYEMINWSKNFFPTSSGIITEKNFRLFLLGEISGKSLNLPDIGKEPIMICVAIIDNEVECADFSNTLSYGR